jgi:hypothetical protein
MKMSGRAFLEKLRQDLQHDQAPMNLRHAAALVGWYLMLPPAVPNGYHTPLRVN